MNQNEKKKLIFEEVKKTCLVLSSDFQSCSANISHELLEEYGLEYYVSVCASMVNSILINLVKSLDIDDEKERAKLFHSLIKWITDQSLETYIKTFNFH